MVPTRRSAVRLMATALIAAAGACVSLGSPAAAACARLSPAEAMPGAPVVFVGTVTAVDAGGAATYHVEEIWKGANVSDPVTVYPVINPALELQAGPSRAVGTRYLVFPTVDPDGNLRDVDCSPTSVYDPAFDALRPAGAHAPQGPPTSGIPGDAPIAGIFLVILVFGSIGGFFLYRTGQRPARAG